MRLAIAPTMPATTSSLMALRFSGRLMVIQNAWPRLSRKTLLLSRHMLVCLRWARFNFGNDPAGRHLIAFFDSKQGDEA